VFKRPDAISHRYHSPLVGVTAAAGAAVNTTSLVLLILLVLLALFELVLENVGADGTSRCGTKTA
jgi:hypothetical protein